MKIIRHTALTCMAVMMLSSSAVAKGPQDATEITQIANNAELGAILGKEIESIAKQVEQITIMTSQLQNLITQAQRLENFLPTNVVKTLNSLRNLVQKTQGLYSALGNMDFSFRMQFPNLKNGPIGYTSWADYHRKQSDYMLDTIESAMKRADIQMSDMEDDARALETLEKRNSSAAGQMQAIQAGNEISAFLGAELIKLRDAVEHQTTFMANYYAKKEHQEMMEQENWNKHGPKAYMGPVTGSEGF